MKKEIDPKHFASVCHALRNSDAKTATKYIDEKTVVRATWRFKPNARNRREEMVVTFGALNYIEREFVKKLRKSGESFPVRKIQLRAYPVKRTVAG